MNNLVIFGGSGIGMIAASVALDMGNYEVMGFLNDVVTPGTLIGRYKKIPVIGKSCDFERYVKEGCHFFVGYVGMTKEESVYNSISNLHIPDDQWASLVHPTAVFSKYFSKIGKGCLLSPLSQLSPDTTLSDNCIMLPNSFLGHDSFMDHFAHIATNGVVGANVHVGKAVHVGSNATIREKIKIGDFSLIGCGSVVLTDVPSNSIVVGNPARVLSRKGVVNDEM